MKIKKLTTIITLLLPISAIAITKPHPAPNEICTLGNSCSYTISGMSKRIITTPNIPAFSFYKCAVTSSRDGLKKLRVENVEAPDNIGYNVSGDLTQNPFLSFMNNSTSEQGSITYNLRNTDIYTHKHSVVYRCDRVNSK